MSSQSQPTRPGYGPDVPAQIEEPTLTLIEHMERSVREWGSRQFCDFLGGAMTYAELGEAIDHAAFALFVAGVRRGDRVSLVMPNCPQHVIAFYAAQRLGAIVAEHNPLATPSELDAQFTLAQPKVVVAWENSISKITAYDRVPGRTLFSVDLTAAMPWRSRLLLTLPLKAARAQREKLRARVPEGVASWEKTVDLRQTLPTNVPRPGMEDTAVLIFTGGTTGTPKAVEITQRNLVSNAMQARAWVQPLREGHETILAALPFFHAFGMTLALTLAPVLAATLVIVPRFDVELVLAAHARNPLTFLGGVPPMFDRLEAAAREGGIDMSSARFSVSGAMALDGAIAKRWEDYTGGYLIEGYGMSECSPVIGANPLSDQRRPGTLGIPFPSTQVRLCDPETPTVPVERGEMGEIQVKGPQVMRGYYRAPQATAECFTEDGWLRTGDVAVEDETGWLTMTDRIKEIIISGGFNIYPSEVEDAVRDMPGVLDVAVVGVHDGSRGEQVVAALVMAPGATADLASVRAWAERKVSHYALPRQVAMLDELPRSALGKVLRRKVGEQLSQAGERIDEARAHAGERIDEAKVRLTEVRSQAGDRIEEVRAQAGERIGEVRVHAGERIGEVRVQAGERIEEARAQLAERRGSEKRAGRHARDEQDDDGVNADGTDDPEGALPVETVTVGGEDVDVVIDDAGVVEGSADLDENAGVDDPAGFDGRDAGGRHSH